MIKILSFTLPAAVVAVFAAAFVARPIQDPQEPEETKLEQHMSVVNKSYRALRKSLKDPEQAADSLASIQKLQDHALDAKLETPKMAAAIPVADQAKFMTEYRLSMIQMVKVALDIEAAILEARHDDALAALKEFNKLKSPAHKRFKAKDEDK